MISNINKILELSMRNFKMDELKTKSTFGSNTIKSLNNNNFNINK